jgi:tRNA splicing ligase
MIRLWLEVIGMQVDMNVEARNLEATDAFTSVVQISSIGCGKVPPVEVVHTTFCRKRKQLRRRQ